MRLYLKVINPALALIAFLLCTWAAIYGEDKINLFGIVAGNFTSYFFAKGLFTSSALFLIGKLLEATMEKSNEQKRTAKRKSERALFVLFLCASIGIFASLYFWGKEDVSTEITTKYEIQKPSELTIDEYHAVRETDRLNIAITLVNHGNSEWNKALATATLFIGGRYSGKSGMSFDNLKPGQSEVGMILFNDIQNEAISDSISCKFEIEANPKH